MGLRTQHAGAPCRVGAHGLGGSIPGSFSTFSGDHAVGWAGSRGPPRTPRVHGGRPPALHGPPGTPWFASRAGTHGQGSGAFDPRFRCTLPGDAGTRPRMDHSSSVVVPTRPPGPATTPPGPGFASQQGPMGKAAMHSMPDFDACCSDTPPGGVPSPHPQAG